MAPQSGNWSPVFHDGHIGTKGFAWPKTTESKMVAIMQTASKNTNHTLVARE